MEAKKPKRLEEEGRSLLKAWPHWTLRTKSKTAEKVAPWSQRDGVGTNLGDRLRRDRRSGLVGSRLERLMTASSAWDVILWEGSLNAS